ncbi:MAG: helix-turn-helix domain-containing protein [Alistipes sp.]|nr:helix-turn-helix domain-containing protein [Alistipes sp.]
MPLAAREHFGTRADNTPTGEYCCFCYREGRFTDDYTLPQKVADLVSYHDESEKKEGRTLTRAELSVRMHLLLPRLGRWSSHENCHVRYYEAVNAAVEYIGANLASPLGLNLLAQVSGISGYHFHRIFRAVMGEAPGEYIQRLRLEKAAFLLAGGTLPVGEIAVWCGYETQQALSRAFRRRYGIAPVAYRKSPVEMKFPVDESADLGVEPDLRHRPAMHLAGARVWDAHLNERAFLEVWGCLAAATGKGLSGDGETEYILLSRDSSTITRPEHYNIYACVSPPVRARGLIHFRNHAGQYAVFTHRGPYEGLSRLYCHIYRWWLPYSGYTLRDSFYFEKFLNSPDATVPDDLRTEIWIPVK